MTREQKLAWVRGASNTDLLAQLVSLTIRNDFGRYDDDIIITRTEILRRMTDRPEK